MERLLLTFILFLTIIPGSFAQETVVPAPKNLQQFYLGFGLGGAFTNAPNTASPGNNTFIHLNAAFNNHKLLRAGLFQASFQDDQAASRKWKEDNHKLNMVPWHRVNSYFSAVGKRKLLSGGIQAQVLAGLSYTTYHEPTNVHQETLDLGFFGAHQVLDYEIKKHNKAGVLLQAEAMVLPLRFAGLTLGGYYHFVPKISNGGFNLSLNLGRVRTKETILN